MESEEQTVAEPAPAEPPRPWAQGVSLEAQERALADFRVGNRHFGEAAYARAAVSYRAALQHWSHPAIHGNLAVCLIHLDSPIEALEQVEAALQWRDEPFEPHAYRQLVTNRTLLRGQLGEIHVVPSHGDAEVVLDGDTLESGERRRMVRAGEHRLVVSLDGYLTYNEAIAVLPGEDHRAEVRLVPLEEAARYERRWPQWIPWTVFGAGVALTAIGVGVQVSAAADIDAFEAEVSRLCPAGCNTQELPGAVADLESRGLAKNRAAVALLASGGSAIAAGVALLVANRLRRVDVDATGTPVALFPTWGSGHIGMVVQIRQ